MRRMPYLLLAASLLLSACHSDNNNNNNQTAVPAPAAPASLPITVSILHTNDTHSQLEPFTPFGEPEQGGVARRKTLIDQVRAAVGADHVITVDAGDFFQGTIFFNAWEGSESIMALNHMGYDVVTLGNHEFDLGPANLARALRGGPVTIANVGYTTEAANMPVVNANLDLSGEPDLADLVEPYTIIEKAGERFGVIGVVTDTVTNISNTGPNIQLRDYVGSVQLAVSALRGEGVNKIILLSHAGYEVDLQNIPQLSGVDVVVSGHDHALLGDADAFAADPELAFMADRVKGPYPTVAQDADGNTVLVVSAYEWGRWLGRVDVSFDADGLITQWMAAPMFVDDNVASDPELENLVAEYRQPVDAFANVIIGQAGMFLDGNRDPGVRTQEMPLGNLVTDVMLAATMPTDNTVAALTNGGGIRASINEGDVTFGDAITVLPFGNTIVALDLTGEELVAALDNGLSWAYDPASGATRSSGSFPQVAGMAVTFCGDTVTAIRAGTTPLPACPGALRNGGVVTGVNIAGGPVNMGGTYRIAINDFLAGGGDFYDMFETACMRPDGYCRDTGVLMLDEFVNEFANNSPVTRALEGRLVAQ